MPELIDGMSQAAWQRLATQQTTPPSTSSDSGGATTTTPASTRKPSLAKKPAVMGVAYHERVIIGGRDDPRLHHASPVALSQRASPHTLAQETRLGTAGQSELHHRGTSMKSAIQDVVGHASQGAKALEAVAGAAPKVPDTRELAATRAGALRSSIDRGPGELFGRMVRMAERAAHPSSDESHRRLIATSQPTHSHGLRRGLASIAFSSARYEAGPSAEDHRDHRHPRHPTPMEELYGENAFVKSMEASLRRFQHPAKPGSRRPTTPSGQELSRPLRQLIEAAKHPPKLTSEQAHRVQKLHQGAAKGHQIVDPTLVVKAAAIAHLPLALALGLLSQESFGGQNVWGYDQGSGAIFTGGIDSKTGRRWGRGFAYTRTVTEAGYRAYRAEQRRILKTQGVLKKQGVGPTMLTDPSLQNYADDAGGSWKRLPNLIIGFSHLAYLIQLHGLEGGLYRYNGSLGYSNPLLIKAREWASELGLKTVMAP